MQPNENWPDSLQWRPFCLEVGFPAARRWHTFPSRQAALSIQTRASPQRHGTEMGTLEGGSLDTTTLWSAPCVFIREQTTVRILLAEVTDTYGRNLRAPCATCRCKSANAPLNWFCRGLAEIPTRVSQKRARKYKLPSDIETPKHRIDCTRQMCPVLQRNVTGRRQRDDKGKN